MKRVSAQEYDCPTYALCVCAEQDHSGLLYCMVPEKTIAQSEVEGLKTDKVSSVVLPRLTRGECHKLTNSFLTFRAA